MNSHVNDAKKIRLLTDKLATYHIHMQQRILRKEIELDSLLLSFVQQQRRDGAHACLCGIGAKAKKDNSQSASAVAVTHDYDVLLRKARSMNTDEANDNDNRERWRMSTQRNQPCKALQLLDIGKFDVGHPANASTHKQRLWGSRNDCNDVPCARDHSLSCAATVLDKHEESSSVNAAVSVPQQDMCSAHDESGVSQSIAESMDVYALSPILPLNGHPAPPCMNGCRFVEHRKKQSTCDIDDSYNDSDTRANTHESSMECVLAGRVERASLPTFVPVECDTAAVNQLIPTKGVNAGTVSVPAKRALFHDCTNSRRDTFAVTHTTPEASGDVCGKQAAMARHVRFTSNSPQVAIYSIDRATSVIGGGNLDTGSNMSCASSGSAYDNHSSKYNSVWERIFSEGATPPYRGRGCAKRRRRCGGEGSLGNDAHKMVNGYSGVCGDYDIHEDAVQDQRVCTGLERVLACVQRMRERLQSDVHTDTVTTTTAAAAESNNRVSPVSVDPMSSSPVYIRRVCKHGGSASVATFPLHLSHETTRSGASRRSSIETVAVEDSSWADAYETTGRAWVQLPRRQRPCSM